VSYPADPEPVGLVLGDLDGDGLVDAVIPDDNVNAVFVLRGAPGGTLLAPIAIAGGNDPASVAIGDLDGDGHPDLAVANGLGGTLGVALAAGACP
jgi:hypothetical protein